MKRINWIALGMLLPLLLSIKVVSQSGMEGSIVFSRNVVGNWDIWCYESAKGTLRQVTNSPSDEVNPVWVGGSGNIAFIREGDIYWIHDKEETRLTWDGNCRYITSDDSGERIVFSSYTGFEESDLAVIDPETKQQRILLTRPGQQIHPSVSADGKCVYFSEGSRIGERVFQYVCVLKTETGVVEPVMSEKGTSTYRPASDPGGGLAAVWFDGGRMGLRVLGSDKQCRTIPMGSYCDYPCWCGDGKLVCTVLANGELKLATVDTRNGAIQVLPITGECRESDWRMSCQLDRESGK